MVDDVIALIPTLNQHHRLPSLIASLYRATVQPGRVLVVDNGGNCPPLARAEIVRPARNLGVAGSWNLGATLAGDQPLLVLNDDVLIGPTALEQLLANRADLVTVNHSWSCFLWRASARQRVGLFDAEFFPAYYEDCDYSYRLKLAGTPHSNVDDASTQHAGSATLHAKSEGERAQHPNDFTRNLARYHRKWGGDPGAERMTHPFGVEADFHSPLSLRVQNLCAQGGDISEHLPTLFDLARQYGSVLELGTRHGVSTTAWLAGGATVQAVDLVKLPEVDWLAMLAGERLRFIAGDSRDNSLPLEPAEILFIDTLHTADQLRQEFANWAHLARRFIVLHDTTTFGRRGEDGGPGLWQAVEEFLLAEAGQWRIGWRLENCHGLTLLERTQVIVEAHP